MCTLTTQHGIKWEVIQLNGRAAYNRDQLTVLWMMDLESYIVMDAMARLVMQGPLQECLDSVRYDLN